MTSQENLRQAVPGAREAPCHICGSLTIMRVVIGDGVAPICSAKCVDCASELRASANDQAEAAKQAALDVALAGIVWLEAREVARRPYVMTREWQAHRDAEAALIRALRALPGGPNSCKDSPKPNVMDAPDHPRCACGNLSQLECGDCLACANKVRGKEMIDRCPHDYGRSPDGTFDNCHHCCRAELAKLRSSMLGARVCRAGDVGVVAEKANNDPLGWHVRWPNGEVTTVREESLVRVEQRREAAKPDHETRGVSDRELEMLRLQYERGLLDGRAERGSTDARHCNLHKIPEPCPTCTDCDHWRWANGAGLGPICQDCGDEIAGNVPKGVRPMTTEECKRNNDRRSRVKDRR